MAENQINLATLWVPVMAETRNIAAQLREAGTVGRREFMQAFSGGSASGMFGNLGNDLRDQLRNGLRMAAAELPPGLNLISQSLISGFDGVKDRTARAEMALAGYTRATDRQTDALARQAVAQARVNELQKKGLAADSSQMLSASAALDSANRKAARSAEDVAAAETLKAQALGKSKNSAMGFVAATGAIGGFGIAVGVSAKAAGDFQQSMIRLTAAAGESSDNIKGVGDGILQLAGQVGTSAQELATAMYTVEKAGFHGASGLDVLSASAQLAKIENAQLGPVISGLTTSMNDFNIPASQAADIASKLRVAVGQAKTNLQDFTGSLHSVEPVAMQAHVSIDQVYGSLARLTQSGMSPDQAAQNLAQTIRNFAGPSVEMRDALGKIGLSATQLQTELGDPSIGLTGVLKQVSDAIYSKVGPSGKVAVDTLYKNVDAAHALQTAYDTLSPSSKAMADQLNAGTIKFRDFRLASKIDPQLAQWATMRQRVDGLSSNLKKLQPVLEPVMQLFKEATGGSETLNVLSQLYGTPEDAQKTADVVKKVSDAQADANHHVEGFAETMRGFNAMMDQFKASFGAAAIQLGTAFLPELTAVAHGLADMGQFLQRNKGLTEGLVITVGSLGTAYLGLKAALGFKHLIDDLRASFFGLNTAAAAANTTMAEAGTAAATGAAGVETAATEEVAAEGRVETAAGTARAALAGIASAAGPAAAAWAGADQVTNAMKNSHNSFLHAAGHGLQSNPFSVYGLYHMFVDGGKAGGGPLHAPGPKGTDSALFWGADGEHVLTADDVNAMGGHGAVYAFRNALHRQDGGPVGGDDGGPMSRLYSEAQSLNGGRYVWGSTDCSGAVSMLVDAALGTSGRMSTATAASWLSAKGFQPGYQPGALNIGWYNGGPGGGHMAATLPDGTHFESGGQHGGIALGGSAAGAENSEFTNHMYLPLNGMYPDGPAGGGGGGGMMASAFGGAFGGGIPPGATAGVGPRGQSGYYMPNAQKVQADNNKIANLSNQIHDLEEKKTELKSTATQSERDRLQHEIDAKNRELAEVQNKLKTDERGTFHALGKGGRAGGDSGANSAAEQFGSSFLKGLLSDFGFGNVFGKSPMDWGIVKLGEGLAKWGMGTLKPFMDAARMGGLGAGAGAALGGGGGGGGGGFPGAGAACPGGGGPSLGGATGAGGGSDDLKFVGAAPSSSAGGGSDDLKTVGAAPSSSADGTPPSSTGGQSGAGTPSGFGGKRFTAPGTQGAPVPVASNSSAVPAPVPMFQPPAINPTGGATPQDGPFPIPPELLPQLRGKMPPQQPVPPEISSLLKPPTGRIPTTQDLLGAPGGPPDLQQLYLNDLLNGTNLGDPGAVPPMPPRIFGPPSPPPLTPMDKSGGGIVPLAPSTVGSAPTAPSSYSHASTAGVVSPDAGPTFNIQQQGMFLDNHQATTQIRNAAYTGTSWHPSMTPAAIA